MAAGRVNQNRQFFLEMDSLLRVNPYDQPGQKDGVAKGKEKVAEVSAANADKSSSFELIGPDHHSKKFERLI